MAVPDLTFSSFICKVDEFPQPGRFDDYAREVMENRQQIAGRTKVDVAYDLCGYFDSHGYETRQDLMDLPKGEPADVGKGTPDRKGKCWDNVAVESLAVDWNHDRHGVGRTTVPSRRSTLHTVSVIPMAIAGVRCAY